MEHESTPADQTAPTRSPEAPAKSVCAVVVSFFPDETFEARLMSVLPQVSALTVVDNTPGGSGERLKSLRKAHSGIHLIENHANVGIASALNQGLAYALQNGYRWILTLDQDTQCYPHMIDTLLRTYEACKTKPAVIGSNYMDGQNHRLAVPPTDNGECQERITVITSGSMIDAKAAYAIGGFRDDYFIDQVDHEFCLRARANGHQVAITRGPVMSHSVGRPGGARLPWLGILPNHPPLRKYYIARNSMVTVLTYWRQEPGWCLRRMTRLVLGLLLMATLERQRLAKVRAFAAGFTDGVRRRMGPCQRDWLHRVR